ncbi:glycoside hydrolase family 28 protein [Ramaria rubella]|nr:glycoside hydrolase family 28 protein [Ramaria rubella]
MLLALFISLFSVSLSWAQLTGSVGPTTTTTSKQKTICNVLDYGGVIGSSVCPYRRDIGPAIGSAFTNCVLKNSGSTLYVPPGSYNMQTWQTLTGGSHWAFQMDGVITRTSTTGGHMIVVQNANDFEFFSSNSAGAIQGNGYQARNAGPRLFRMITSTNWSVHDLIFVDSPEFHIIIQEGSNGELYNLAIRGANIGGSDGIDISGVNHWVHDIEVTNRDECVTIKNPASNILVERIWCNQSGGSAIGSLGTGTAIQNILYRNIYTNGGNQIFMIKSWGGDGYVSNVAFQTFLSRGTAYGLDVNQYWSSQTEAPGAGVQLTNISFTNWDGEVVDGVQRSPIQILCADGAPCQQMTLSNVNLWSATNQATNKCQSAYGKGACLKSSGSASYAATTTTITEPAGYTTPPTLAGDLVTGFATNSPIPIPTIPSTYYPGLPQISPLAKNK